MVELLDYFKCGSVRVYTRSFISFSISKVPKWKFTLLKMLFPASRLKNDGVTVHKK